MYQGRIKSLLNIPNIKRESSGEISISLKDSSKTSVVNIIGKEKINIVANISNRYKANVKVEKNESLVVKVEKLPLITLGERESFSPEIGDKSIYLIAGEAISAEKPLIFDDNTKRVFIAKSNNINHFKKYIGISLNNANIGEAVHILIYGLYFSNNFNFDITRELYIGNGDLIQDMSYVDNVYQQQIGNVLTPNTIFLNYLDPFLV